MTTQRKYRLYLMILTLSSSVCYAEKILQSIDNIELYPTTEGNQFKLSQLKQGCKIEAHFFGEIGKTQENYIFKQQNLLYAARYEYHYSKGGLTNLSENKGNFKTQRQRIELNPQSSQTIADFQQYLALFSPLKLKKCFR